MAHLGSGSVHCSKGRAVPPMMPHRSGGPRERREALIQRAASNGIELMPSPAAVLGVRCAISGASRQRVLSLSFLAPIQSA
jgi:hypothetical protein